LVARSRTGSCDAIEKQSTGPKTNPKVSPEDIVARVVALRQPWITRQSRRPVESLCYRGPGRDLPRDVPGRPTGEFRPRSNALHCGEESQHEPHDRLRLRRVDLKYEGVVIHDVITLLLVRGQRWLVSPATQGLVI